MAKNTAARDDYGRQVSYMRLSVTDRCNLRCIYCRSDKSRNFIPHADILTYEELIGLIKLGRELGIEKLRLTGGEPFCRRDFLAFLGMIREECPGLDTRMTTNGVMLAGKAPALKHLGENMINISLDTLNPEKFKRVTGFDNHAKVMDGIRECIHYGLKVKVNVVAMKGINDGELADFVDFARENPVDVRFIEFMPIGGKTCWRPESVWRAGEIMESVKPLADIEPVREEERNKGPARMYDLKGGRGRIGFISPMSDHFCDTCNRLRITSDGRLRTCLFSDREVSLRPLIRDPEKGFDAALAAMREEIAKKPRGYEILQRLENGSVCDKTMSSIGG
jgi:cyclic pyranopterin phosphate synthase